jgi:hypothetical protein
MMAGTLRVRRSQGALSGVLLVLLGIWGALIAFVGPYFHYAYTPDRPFVATSGRMWLEVLPGVVALAGGVVVLMSRFRPAAVLGAWLAALAGAWFAVGDLIAVHWARLPGAGVPTGGGARAAAEQIGFFTGLGVVIVFVAALALGRFTVVAARDAATAATRNGAGSDAATSARAADDTVPAQAVSPRAVSPERAPAAPAGSRSANRVKVVPVFRARQRSAARDTAPASADAASASADDAEVESAEATADVGQAH